MRINRLLIFGLVWGILFVYAACRKVDMPVEKEKVLTLEQKQAKFYNSHPSGDPYVKALNAHLKRVNIKADFVEKTIERVGYPIWNKAQIMKTVGRGGRGATDSVTYSYVPFSLETENIVNASLIFRTSITDTITYWVCDWQYADMPHGSPSVSGTAEYTALFFMQFQHLTFGDSIFYLSDSSLFQNISWPAWGNGRRGLKVRLDNTGERSGNRPNSVWECSDIYHCGAPSAEEWPECFDASGCDYDEGCPGTGSYRCYLQGTICVCIIGCGGTEPPYQEPPRLREVEGEGVVHRRHRNASHLLHLRVLMPLYQAQVARQDGIRYLLLLQYYPMRIR